MHNISPSEQILRYSIIHSPADEERLRVLSNELQQDSRPWTTFSFHTKRSCCHVKCDANKFAARVIKLPHANGRKEALECRDSTAKNIYHFILKCKSTGLFNHPIISPGFIFELDASVHFLSYWWKNGNILEYVSTNLVSHSVLAKLVRQMGEGLAYLHSHDIIHGNFCPYNVMITDAGRATITDIGTYNLEAAAAIELGQTVPPRSSLPYKPLEEFQFEGDIEVFTPSKNTDVYSFAASAYTVFTRKDIAARGRACILANPNGLLTLKRPDHIAPSTWTCLQNCWSLDVMTRPVMEDILVYLTTA
ncbi:hypothetical protein APHAL10511_004283 [Amanita phalloides]|nr:hypothetical protein APHAL10511_004283 [Amanita phalloides]